MSNQATGVKTPVMADSWSGTVGNLVRLSHVWIIENFSFYQTDKVIVSPPFSSGRTGGIQWCLKLYPNGANDEITDHISVQLSLSPCETAGVPASYEISILDAEKNAVRRILSGSPQLFEPGQGRGPEFFIRRDSVLSNRLHCLPDDKLTVFCEVTALVKTFNLSGWSSMRQSANESVKVWSQEPDSLMRTRASRQGDRQENGPSSGGRSGSRSVASTDSGTIHSTKGGDGTRLLRRERPRRSGNSIEDGERCDLLSEVEAFITETEMYMHRLEEQYAAEKAMMNDMMEQHNNVSRVRSMKFNEADAGNSSACPIDLRRKPSKPPSGERDGKLELLRELVDGVRAAASDIKRKGLKNSASIASKPMKTAKPTHPAHRHRAQISRNSGNRSDDLLMCPSSSEDLESIDIPMLDLDVFDGDAAAFYGWWLEFKREVHDRKDVSFSQKLNCLKSLLEGDATMGVAETAFGEADYILALRKLFFTYAGGKPFPSELLPIFNGTIKASLR